MRYSSDAAADAPRLVSLIGGSGFVGTALAEAFARAGWRVRIVCRDVSHSQHARPLGDVGQVGAVRADITVPGSLGPAVEGADLVVNLVGLLKGKAADFERVHVAGARNVAEAARALGCGAMIQMSAIGADSGSASIYGRTKAAGEAAVAEAFPGVIIVRPSLIFGPDDGLTNRFATMMTRSPSMPVIAGDTRFQPVHVGDVADAVVELAQRLPDADAAIYELGGPEVLTMRELLARIAEACEREMHFFDMSNSSARFIASLPFAPVTRDQLLMLGGDNVVAGGAKGLAGLGIVPTPLGAVAHGWLSRYRPGGRFAA